MRRSFAALSLVVVVLIGGCAQESGVNVEKVPSEVTGVIVSIDPEEGHPESFTLRDAEDRSYEIAIADDIDYGFDLHHLHEHMTSEDPVIVSLDNRDGDLVATSIEDA